MPKTKQSKFSGEVQHYKSTKTGDTLVGPSLPPFVEGQLRCFLHFAIGNLKWNGPVALKDVQIGVKWWGQQSKPILLRPRHEAGKGTRTKHEVKYPIRSGPKQFTAYLKDMGALILDVLSHGNIIGQINITDIGLLCHSRPIKGFYSVVSSMQGAVGKEIGMLYVSLEFHSVSGSINMTSSTIPTTDMSSPSAGDEKTMKGKFGYKKGLDKMETERKKQKGVTISSASPERIEYSLHNSETEVPSFVVGPGRRHADNEMEQREDRADYIEMKKDVMKKPGEVLKNVSASKTLRHSPSMSNREVADALAELIKRGQNLRNRMMFSAIETPQPPNEFLNHSGREERRGALFQDILDQVDQEDSINPVQANFPNDEKVYGVEQTLVDLVTGDDTNQVGRILKKLERDPDASISDELSDVEDPTHEDSLITDLFYTAENNEESESSVLLTDDSESEKKGPALKSPYLEDAGNKRSMNRKHRRRKIKADSPEGGFNMQKAERKPGNLENSNSMTYLNPNTTEDDSVENGETGDSTTAALNFVKSMEKLIPEGMDLDTVTTLARVQFARVIVHTLDLKSVDSEIYNDCTFFVEYDFPVSSLENISKMTSYSELTRCASNKLQEESILFNHRSVFPVHFDAAAIASWWNRQVTFKLYTRSRTEHTPTFVGKNSFALRKIFLSEAFALSEGLTIVKKSDEDESIFGALQVYVELASEKADIKGKGLTAKSALAVEPPQKHQTPMQIQTKDTEKPRSVNPISRISQIPEKHENQIELPQVQHATMSQALPKQGCFLKSLLFIGDGRGVSCSPKGHLARPANCYLVCRMFWDEEASKSQVCWNTLDPEFNFIQTIPVVLDAKLLERAKNNFMVVEVWDKSLSSADDTLIGVVKVSLHPFYMSFKETSIAKTLLQSQYPVIAVDGLVKINDLFGNRECGQLYVLLALGSQDQIENLLSIKGKRLQKFPPEMNREFAIDSYERVSYAQRSDLSSGKQVNNTAVDHIFGISIENAKNLGASFREESAERDCFVQYQFPEQQNAGRSCSLTWHTTPTILLVDNPVFGYSQKHVLTAAVDAPVQHLFLSSFEDRRTPSGIAFEIWQRSYFPNIRDCVLYKAMIPVSKIYAMIAMSRTKESSFQTFKLPLSPIDSNSSSMYDEDAELNISISYQERRHITSSLDLYESLSPCVCISVGILRACGLKACVLNQSKREYAGVSTPTTVNTFVKVSISFLGPGSARISPVIARTFAPTFSFHVDFPVNVTQDFIEDDEHDESSTLAYQLESGFLHAQIFQKKVKSGFLLSKYDEMEDDNSEVLIGDCRVPLSGLLSKSTGIKGWFPINRPYRKRPKQVFHQTCDADEFGDSAGGLEIALNFAKESDREMVINTARGIGWSPLESLEMHEDSFSAAATAEVPIVGLTAHVSVNKVWIATEILEKLADKDIPNLKLYCRYKFYDKVALVTKLVPLVRTSSTDVMSADLNHVKQFQISASSALSWYLREELIEFQFWLRIIGKEQSSFISHNRDKLIGSVFTSAATISRNATLQGSVSGLYPMYKFGADFIGKSSARVSIHIANDEGQRGKVNSRYNESIDGDYPQASDSEEVSVTTPSTDSSKAVRARNNETENLNSVEGTDAVIIKPITRESDGEQFRIIIEEALHLPVEVTSHGTRPPSTYVSYQLTPFHKAVCTSIVYDSIRPKWNVENMERIDPSKLPNQMISFKVFKKAPEKDKKPDVDKDILLGTASVDLSLLTTGFRQIHGWYNLVDFAGQQNGQIKIGVIPEKPLATSPSSRYFRKETLVDKLHRDVPWTHNRVARPLVFDESYLQKNKDTKDKTEIKLAVKPDQDDAILSETSKSVLFNRLRDQIIGLDTLNKDLRSKLEGNSERVPDASGFLSFRSGEQNCVGSKENSFGPSAVLQSPLDEKYHLPPDTLTTGGNTGHHTSGDTGMEEESRSIVDSVGFRTVGSNRKQRDLLELLADDGSYPQATGNDEIHNEKTEAVVENLSVTKLSFISDSEDWKFDSFEDVLNYKKQGRDDSFLESSVLDERAEAFDHSQSDNETVAKDEEPLPLQKSLSVDSDSEYHLGKFTDISSVERSEQVYLEKRDYPNSSALILDNEQSPTLYEMQSSTQERIDDILENGDEILNTSGDLNDAAQSKSANLKGTEKMLDLPEDSAISGRGLLQCSTAPEEDSAENVKEQCSNQDGFSLNSQLVADKAIRSNAPNFFMSQEKLAQSMQKLRLAVTHQFGDPKRKEDVESSESFGIDTDGNAKRRLDRRKNYYATRNVKVSLDKPPPLESSEMNRIASIFSTKFT